MRFFATAVVAAAVLMTAQSVSAQTFMPPASEATAVQTAWAPRSFSAQSASVRRSSRRERPGLRAYGIFESEALTASQSFDAVLGSSRLELKGAGADLVHLWKGAFVRVTVTKGKKSGQRVFVTSSKEVIPLNIPLTVQMTPLEIGGGWRFGSLDGGGHIVPYVGANGLWLHYKETSQFSEPGEDTDETFKGSSVFGGIDVGISFVRVGIEGLYRRVPKALGDNGVSESFGEHDLGGAAVRVTFGIGF
jgi:hypothetical protein